MLAFLLSSTFWFIVAFALLAIMAVGVIVLRVLENRQFAKSTEISDEGIPLEKLVEGMDKVEQPMEQIYGAPMEIDEFLVSETQEAEWLGKFMAHMLGKIKIGQERLVVKVFIEPVHDISRAKKGGQK